MIDPLSPHGRKVLNEIKERNKVNYSFHHGLFTKSAYESQGSTKMLRNNPWLIMPLDEQTHRELHVDIPALPLLSPNTAQSVLKEFRPVKGNYVATIFALMEAVGDANRHPRATPIEKEIGGLLINGLELQLPFIQDGLVDVPYVPTSTGTRDFQSGKW